MKGYSNHRWKDCFNNPKLDNFKGTTKIIKNEVKEEENKPLETLEDEGSCEEEFHFLEPLNHAIKSELGVKDRVDLLKFKIKIEEGPAEPTAPIDKWIQSMEGHGHAIDLYKILQDQTHHSMKERDRLKFLLLWYTDLFVQHRGRWKGAPVSYQLRENYNHSMLNYTKSLNC